MTASPAGSLVTPKDCTPAEWQARVDLAAAYRLAHNMSLNEGICNHFTAMVPGTADCFLVIPYGLLWAEVSAANLLTVQADPSSDGYKVLRGQGAPEATAFFIHSRMHLADPARAAAVFHTHQAWATALCCLKDPSLRMVHQNCLRFAGDIAYDTVFNGLVDNSREGDRLSAVLAGRRILFHTNHGIIVTGRTIAEAFDDMYYLEKACEIVVKALSTNQELQPIRPEVAKAFKAAQDADGPAAAKLYFEALKRDLKRSAKDANFDGSSCA